MSSSIVEDLPSPEQKKCLNINSSILRDETSSFLSLVGSVTNDWIVYQSSVHWQITSCHSWLCQKLMFHTNVSEWWEEPIIIV